MREDIITGQKDFGLEAWARKHKMNTVFARSLAKTLDDPDETPYLLNSITDNFEKLKKHCKDELRDALIRVQIYCSIHGNSDPIKLSKQLFVAQTIERLLFGTNILIEGAEEEEDEHRHRTKK